jgi:hypothetical protein
MIGTLWLRAPFNSRLAAVSMSVRHACSRSPMPTLILPSGWQFSF